MLEKSCAFEADSFVRVDSSELNSDEPVRFQGEVGPPQRRVDDRRSECLPMRAVVSDAAVPAALPGQPGDSVGEPDDLAIVARSCGGIKRHRYELRISYYLSLCFRFGFLLRFLQGLLGKPGRDQDWGVHRQPDVPLEPDKSETVWRRS
jgi:hypothetical protein